MSTDKKKLKDMKKAFIGLLELVDQAVDKFRFSQGGYDELITILEKLDYHFENLRGIKNNIEDEESPYLVKLIEQTDDTNQILSRIMGALESKDTVLIGDLLEYELKPRINDWNDLVGRLLVKENWTN
ncbi:MAG: hypothetical protein ACM3QZ_02320 [Solirubrobacterales bacterium]